MDVQRQGEAWTIAEITSVPRRTGKVDQRDVSGVSFGAFAKGPLAPPMRVVAFATSASTHSEHYR